MIVLKELNETRIWLQFTVAANMVRANLMEDLLEETEQLCRIIAASIQAAQKSRPN
jgi:four helix bundle protein